ncbi:hypothetical protein Tco_0266890 [Tanacetum coccineum]
MVGSSIYTVTSVLTQRELDHHCAVFNISAELRPELLDRNAVIKDSSEGKIGMHTRFIEFANFRIPSSKLLLCILEYYQINLSQLSVINVAKVSHFEIMCRVLGRVPTVELLNENRIFIRKYPKIFLCLVGLIRSFIETDVRPTLLHSNDKEMGLLDFVNYVNPFKLKIGDRTLAENEVPLIDKTKDRVISPSPQTISLVYHTIQDVLNVNVSKRKKKVAFISGSPPVKKAQTEGADTGSGSVAPAAEDATSSSVTPTSEHAFKGDFHDNVRARPPSGYFVVLSSSSANTNIPTSPQVVPLVSSAQAGANVLVTEPASDASSSSVPELEAEALSATPSQGSFADDFYESQTIDFAFALNVYVPNWNITNNARIDNSVTCWNLLDHVTPPGYWVVLHNQHDAEFLESFNINSAQHVSRLEESEAEAEAVDVAELRKRVSDLEAVVAMKLDGKVAQLTADCDGLRGQVVGEGKMREEFVSQQDATERRFSDQAMKLDAHIADVRRDMDNDLYPHMLTAIAGRRWVVGHGFRLAVYKCARFVECHSALGKVILMAINKGIQQGLEAGVVHGKTGRSLTQIEAYDPEIEGKYVAAVFEFENVSFPLLDELEGLKDSLLALIMSALTLKDDHGNTDATPEFRQFQPSLDQVTVPIYSESGSIDHEMLLSDAIPAIRESAKRKGLCPPLSSTLGRASSSAPPHDSSLGVADYQVSTLVLSGDGGSANQPPVVQPHDDLFDTSVLDKSGDA